MSSLLFPPAKPEGAREGFYQDEWWRDSAGQWHKIAEMNVGHVTNVLAFLLRRADIYAMRYTWSMYSYAADASDAAADAIEMEISAIERDPKAWIKSTPLYRALKKRRKSIIKALKKAGKSL